MRCVCCNKNLNDFESTRKHADTGEYLDMCNYCLSWTEIPVQAREDLEPSEGIEMDDFDGEYIDYSIMEDNDD